MGRLLLRKAKVGAYTIGFHLYNDPKTGRPTWFSWDHNLTFSGSRRHLFTLDKAVTLTPRR